MAKKILVIDDEELIAKSLLKFLKSKGFDVIIAKSGNEAFKKVKEDDFDLIISDIKMPKIDGIETVKKIREHLRKSGKQLIPEILITGYADMEKYEKAMDLEVADCLYKPFDNTELLRVIQENIQ